MEAFLSLEDVDYILLDNMSHDMLRAAVEMRGKSSVKLEASGAVTHETIAGIAETGVDYISVGALTHWGGSVSINITLTEY